MNKEEIIDFNDPKVKHCSEQYMNMPSSPEPDDILYWCKSKKKQIFTTHDLIKTFGLDKLEQINKTMEWLDFNNYISVIEQDEWTDPKSIHWFYFEGDESVFTQTWEEFENGQGQEDHIGLDKSYTKTEAEEMYKADTGESGSIMITKYNLLNGK